MSEKLDSDVDLMKAVEQLDEELRPFIDAQLESRGLPTIEEQASDEKWDNLNVINPTPVNKNSDNENSANENDILPVPGPTAEKSE